MSTCCYAGTYPSGPGGVCNQCPANYWCDGWTQHACPANTQSLAGSTSSAACGCVAGFYGVFGSVTCTVCPSNYYCTGGSSEQACTPNSSSPPQSGSSTACVCNQGYYTTGATCSRELLSRALSLSVCCRMQFRILLSWRIYTQRVPLRRELAARLLLVYAVLVSNRHSHLRLSLRSCVYCSCDDLILLFSLRDRHLVKWRPSDFLHSR